jgi:hypothetical protein
LKRRRRGFTLPEALVAFAIVVLSLSVLIRGLGLQFRGEASAGLILQAKNHAENRLARLGHDLPLTVGERSGVVDDDLVWSEVIGYWSEHESRFDGLRALKVTIDVRRKQGGQLLSRLETVKLALADGVP